MAFLANAKSHKNFSFAQILNIPILCRNCRNIPDLGRKGRDTKIFSYSEAFLRQPGVRIQLCCYTTPLFYANFQTAMGREISLRGQIGHFVNCKRIPILCRNCRNIPDLGRKGRDTKIFSYSEAFLRQPGVRIQLCCYTTPLCYANF